VIVSEILNDAVVVCGLVGSKMWIVVQVVAESDYNMRHVATLSLRLQRGCSYIILPSTDRPGM
jgi:hypothetical protein